MAEPNCATCAEYHKSLESLLRVVDRVLFNQPTKADYAAIEAAHQLVRRCVGDTAALAAKPSE
jgi:hypothetical protein